MRAVPMTVVETPFFLRKVPNLLNEANLTKAERNDFRTLVPLLVKTYGKSRQI